MVRRGAGAASAVALPRLLVLEGGFLKKAEVFPAQCVVGGVIFVTLWKSDPVLTNFLTQDCVKNRPLAKTNLIERLQACRDAAVAAALEPDGPDRAEDAEADKAGSLDLDDEAEAVAASSRRRPKRRDFAMLPPTLAVTVGTSDGPWELRVHTQNATCAVAIEATPENLQRLWDETQKELRSERDRRSKWGATQGDSAHFSSPTKGVSYHRESGSWLARRPASDPVALVEAASVEAAAAAGASAARCPNHPYKRRFKSMRFRPSSDSLGDEAEQQAGWFCTASDSDVAAFAAAKKRSKKEAEKQRVHSRSRVNLHA